MTNSGSIERYNNDYYINQDDVSVQYFRGALLNRAIKDSSNWSLSCFLYLKSGKPSNTYHVIYNDYTPGSFRGMLIGYRVSNNSITIIRNGVSGNTQVNSGVGNPNANYGEELGSSKLDRWFHLVVTYDSIANEFEFYYDSIPLGKITGVVTDQFGHVDTDNVAIGVNIAGPSVNNCIDGAVRDFSTYDKILSNEEVKYIYLNNNSPVSAYNNIKSYFSINEIPNETGGNYFLEDKSQLYNINATKTDLQAIGWTGSDLGIPNNATSTTYRGWGSKSLIIPSVGYKKGLNFDNSKSQYLTVTGLDSFDKSDGYTILIGVESDILNTSQKSLFSCLGDEGLSEYYDIYRNSGSVNEYVFVSPKDVGTITDITSNDLTNSIDGSNNNFLSYYVSSEKYVNPFNTTRISKVVDVNCQQDFTGAFTTTSDKLGLGFDEITNPIFNIGAINGSQTFLGKISYFVIIKRAISKEEEKRLFNNGNFQSPFDVINDFEKIIIDVDFQNPFDNAGTITFPDNSSNCVVTTNGTDWNTLAGVQASID